MAPSLLLSLEHDDALGTASVEMALGATEFRGSANDPVSMTFGGFTASMDVDDTAGSFKVSNLGFVNGPLRLIESDGSSVALGLQALGFAFEERIEQLVFNTALNLTLNATLIDQDFGNTSFGFKLAGPAGTRLDTASDSVAATTVVSGGPLQLDYTVSASGSSESGYVTWRTGSCQSSASVPEEQSVVMALFGC